MKSSRNAPALAILKYDNLEDTRNKHIFQLVICAWRNSRHNFHVIILLIIET